MSRFMLRFSSIALALGMVFAVAAPAYADDPKWLSIKFIRCNNQSEPFSDEIRLRVNGDIVASWNDVDQNEVHWYYSTHTIARPNGPLNLPFTGDSVFIDILEEDGHDLGLIGSLEVPAWMLDAGETEWPASMNDGAYSIQFLVTSNPI
jgi:hypothetical protein